jgi:hypothetical protein
VTRAARLAPPTLALLALLGPGGLVVGSAGAQIARPQKAKLELEPRALRASPGAEVRLDARAIVEPGWHVQAHVPTYDYLIPTTLTFELPAGSPGVGRLPAGRYKFSFADDKLDCREGPSSGAFHGGAAPGDPVHARAALLQACDDKLCPPPVDARRRCLVIVASAAWRSLKAACRAGRSRPLAPAAKPPPRPRRRGAPSPASCSWR